MMTAAMTIELSAGMSQIASMIWAYGESSGETCHTSKNDGGKAKDNDMQPLGSGGNDKHFQRMNFSCTSRYTTHLWVMLALLTSTLGIVIVTNVPGPAFGMKFAVIKLQ